jgi:hypothetical protein
LTLLPDGRVLVAGGQNGADGPLAVEVFDPSTETFVKLPISLQTARMAHSATLLPDGGVLFAGGWCPPSHATTSTVEVLSPGAMTVMNAPALAVDIHDFATVLFPDGLLLIAGGKQVDKEERSLDGGWVFPVGE